MSEENQFEGREESSKEELPEQNQEEALYQAIFEPPVEEIPPKKKERRISVSAFLCTCIALVLAAVMTTYTCCNLVYQKKLAEAQLTHTTAGSERY